MVPGSMQDVWSRARVREKEKGDFSSLHNEEIRAA
jgi:hypothetical protein